MLLLLIFRCSFTSFAIDGKSRIESNSRGHLWDWLPQGFELATLFSRRELYFSHILQATTFSNKTPTVYANSWISLDIFTRLENSKEFLFLCWIDFLWGFMIYIQISVTGGLVKFIALFVTSGTVDNSLDQLDKVKVQVNDNENVFSFEIVDDFFIPN